MKLRLSLAPNGQRVATGQLGSRLTRLVLLAGAGEALDPASSDLLTSGAPPQKPAEWTPERIAAWRAEHGVDDLDTALQSKGPA